MSTSNNSGKPTGKIPDIQNENENENERSYKPLYIINNTNYIGEEENEISESNYSLPFRGGSRKFKNGKKRSHRSRQSKKHKSKHLKNNSNKRKSKKRV